MSAIVQLCSRSYQMLEDWKGAEYIQWMKYQSPHFPLIVACVYLLFTLLVPRFFGRRVGTLPLPNSSAALGGCETLAGDKFSVLAVESVEINAAHSNINNLCAVPEKTGFVEVPAQKTPPPSHVSSRQRARAEPLVRESILKPVIAAWNIALSFFSLVGFVCSAPILYRIVVSEYVPGLAPKYDPALGQLVVHPQVPGGLYTSLCYWNANIFQDGVSGFWLLWFDLSKIPELMDTVFLILQNKPVAFIHWYHHITVMLFCWHAHVTYISNGLWFAVMNMGVHAIMYFYYFMCAIGLRKRVRRFAPLITMMQLVQMVAGLVLVSYTGYLHWTHPRSCETNTTSIVFGLGMYSSYFLLFVKFFREAYLAGSKEKRSTGPATPPSS